MPENVIAAEATQVTLAGGFVAIVVAALGLLGTRKSRPEAAAVLVDSALKLSAAASADNSDLRADNAELRLRLEAMDEIVAELQGKVRELSAEVAECQRKHSRAESALASAGIVIDDR